MKEIVVVGAGAAGLSAAWHLNALGEIRGKARIRLLEASDRPGGRLETHEEDGFRVEWAAHGWTGSSRFATELALQLGLESEVVAARAGAARRYIYRGGRLHRLPGSLLGGGLLSLSGRLRLLAEPWISRNRQGGDESVEEFAIRRLGPEAGQVLASAAMAGIFGGDSREISLGAAFPQVRDLEREHGSLLRGAFAAVRGRSQAPPRSGPRGSMLCFRRGMGRWGTALAEAIPGLIQWDCPVSRIAPEGGRVRVEAGTGEILADAVVLALGPGPAARLLEPFEPDGARVLGAIPSASLAVVALAFPAGSFRGPADGYGFLVPRGEDLKILGALWETNVFEERAPEGVDLLRVMIGGARSPELLEKSDAELVEIALGDLERAAGLAAPPAQSWVRRQVNAIPQYTRGHLDRVATAEASLAEFPGILLAGSGYRGVSVSACLEDGRRAALKCVELLG